MDTQIVERTIILPLKDNDGATLRSVHIELRAALLAIAGGFSHYRLSGAWQNDNGVIFTDKSIAYVVLVGRSVDSQIVALLPNLAVSARQEAILTYSRDVAAQFVTGVLPESKGA